MKDNDLSGARGGIQVIERAAAILRVLKQSQSGMSLGQISKAVGLPRSTVQRIVAALQKELFVIADARGGGLRLGPELNALSEATQYNIVESCRLLLTELTQATGETADLSVLRGAAMIFLDQVPGIHRLRTVSSVGEVFPLTTTANGRACLALLPEAQARKLIVEEWERRDIKGNLRAFLATMNDIRKTGLAYDLDEHTDGISAIGIAFADWTGDLHSISIPVPSTRFVEMRSTAEVALKSTARHVRKMMDQGSRENTKS